ncbi:helix-turn-helix domain-containing protein [Corynebacterium argentoratense]|uniref:helix-turn-helix domain-containing protein n=1 Tax=Corynebacterium argentoratense TaxID=42817 RepID=UPI001F165D4B|nr:helix-turn-helix domain-containing protein [Corynebacterium argentoratense]MCF1712250.1 helix-turn-helix domain-containing protein [Corynebacterium argentoratense]
MYETVNDAAERLGVSRDTIYRYIRAGKLPVYRRRVGRGVRLLPVEVDAAFFYAPPEVA